MILGQPGASTGVTTELFHLRLFSMLLRYETLFFLDQGTQGALPHRAFTHLQKTFGVTHECFASPLNVSVSKTHELWIQNKELCISKRGIVYQKHGIVH